jgi:hypothetical protein
VTAALIEERRKDREEYRQLWRESQRQISELTIKIAETNDTITRLAEESSAADRRLREEFREADAVLKARIESLVSAMGESLNGLPK